MLQALLADRFKLVVRRDSKEHTVYGLVVGKGGIKMKESEEIKPAEGEAAPNPAVTGSSSVTINQTQGGAVVTDGSGRKQKMSMAPDGKSMRLEASGITMAELAEGLSPMTDHPVIDMTGLKGKYDFKLTWTPDGPQGFGPGGPLPPGVEPPPPPDPNGPTIFSALQDQLGLKLESEKGPVDMIVIDGVEKASEN